MRLRVPVSEDRVGKGEPEHPRSLGGEEGLGVSGSSDAVGESEPRGSSSLRDMSQGREVGRSIGPSVVGGHQVGHLDRVDGACRGSNVDACGSATRAEGGTQLSPTTSSRNDSPCFVAGRTASETTGQFLPGSAAAGWDGRPPPTVTPGLHGSLGLEAAATTDGAGAHQAGVVVDGGSMPRDERAMSPASGEEISPEEEEEEEHRVSIATGNEQVTAVLEVEVDPEVLSAPAPVSLPHPPPATASEATHLCVPLEATEGTRESPPSLPEGKGQTKIAPLGVLERDPREEGGGVGSAPLRHRGPVEEDGQ
ncbi:unnamed protein product, partial [Ectocarpus fasciculatus]